MNVRLSMRQLGDGTPQALQPTQHAAAWRTGWVRVWRHAALLLRVSQRPMPAAVDTSDWAETQPAMFCSTGPRAPAAQPKAAEPARKRR